MGSSSSSDKERFKLTAQYQLWTAKSPAGFEKRVNGGLRGLVATSGCCSGPRRPCPGRMAQRLPAAQARPRHDTLRMASVSVLQGALLPSQSQRAPRSGAMPQPGAAPQIAKGFTDTGS